MDNYIPEFKSQFKNELKNFIIYNRSNGYAYTENTCGELSRLDKFFVCLNTNDKTINQDIVDKWLLCCKDSNKEVTKGKYFSIISKFCKYLRIMGYENIIQPESHNITYKCNFIPYIFSKEEITKINNTLLNMTNINEFNNLTTFYVMFNLYYCCGLRRSEVLNLKLKDLNHKDKIIFIENSKNNTSRVIPLTDKLFNLITQYLNIRNSELEYIFISEKNKRINKQYVSKLFKKVLKEAEIPLTYEGKTQRLHDLRHSFAVHTLKQMEEKNFDLYTSLPILSAYLGHKSIVETEYYLRLVKSENENIINKSINYTKNLYGKKDNFYEE